MEEHPSCSSANNVVSSLLKPCISSAFLAQPNRGPGLLSIISTPAGCHVPSVPRPCARGGERLKPAFGFFCLHLRETSMHGELGSLGWGVRVYSSAVSRNPQPLLNSFGCFLSSHCPDFVLVWFGWRRKEGRVGGVILCGQQVTFPLTLLFVICFSLASLVLSTHAVGGVGAAREMPGRVVVTLNPCRVTQCPLGPKQGCSLSVLPSVASCSSIPAGSIACSLNSPNPDFSAQFPGCEALVRFVWPRNYAQPEGNSFQQEQPKL